MYRITFSRETPCIYENPPTFGTTYIALLGSSSLELNKCLESLISLWTFWDPKVAIFKYMYWNNWKRFFHILKKKFFFFVVFDDFFQCGEYVFRTWIKSSIIAKLWGRKQRKSWKFYYYLNGRFWSQKCWKCSWRFLEELRRCSVN